MLTWGSRAANLGRNQDLTKPVALNLDGVTKASMGLIHSAAIDANGNLYTFGDGAFGALA